MTPEEAIEELKKNEGLQFDPKLVKPFVESL
jgi:HD-GYP domain-containing protein (c-di-GMP phosphodiesterase class II)